MEVRIDERRRDEVARGVDHPRRLAVDAGFHGDDPVAADGDVGDAAVREGAALDEEVDHHRKSGVIVRP